MRLTAVVVGPGRMGSAVASAWRERGHEVASVLARGDSLEAARSAHLAFEFTRPDAAAENVEALVELGVATVCGTTGWDPASVLRLAGERGVPLLVAPNFSLGVAVLRALVCEAARRLAAFPEFEPGLVERHHARKADSPSGTARMLAEAIGELRGVAPPVAALRHGDQPGEHRVIFEGCEESLELVHRARSRRVFALGAVRAGEWLATTRPRGAVSFARFLEEVAESLRPAQGEYRSPRGERPCETG